MWLRVGQRSDVAGRERNRSLTFPDQVVTAAPGRGDRRCAARECPVHHQYERLERGRQDKNFRPRVDSRPLGLVREPEEPHTFGDAQRSGKVV